jgi:hypothetical protein
MRIKQNQMVVNDHDGNDRVVTVDRYGRERDNQRRRYYRWESNALIKENVDRDAIRPMVKLACELFEVDVPFVEFSSRAHRKASYWPGEKKIQLPSEVLWAHEETVILHETAHHIHKVKGREWEASHGPGFASIHIFLMGFFTSNKIGEMKRSVRKWKVEVGDVNYYIDPSRYGR